MPTKYTKLKDKKLKARWLKALRSGRYKQGFTYLLWPGSKKGPDKEMFCCLGVLGLCAGNKRTEMVGNAFLKDEKGNYSLLNEVTQRRLAELNDDPDSDGGFKSIADWIEKHL